MAGSEVARILQQIREEEEAAKRAQKDFAMTGKHAFINGKIENMGRYVDILTGIVGSRDAALQLVIVDQMEREMPHSFKEEGDI